MTVKLAIALAIDTKNSTPSLVYCGQGENIATFYDKVVTVTYIYTHIHALFVKAG